MLKYIVKRMKKSSVGYPKFTVNFLEPGGDSCELRGRIIDEGCLPLY